VLALVAALIVGELIDSIVNSATPAARRADSSWLAAVTPVVASSTSLQSTLAELRSLDNLPSCSSSGCQRTTFDVRLADLQNGTAADLAALAAIRLEPPSARADQLLVEVLHDRSLAVDLIAQAVSVLLGSASSHVTLARAQGLLLAARAQLATSDREFVQFTRRLPPHLGGARLRSSVWLVDPKSWNRTGVTAWAESLVASVPLQSRASIALLAVSTDPPVLTITGDHPATTTTTTKAPATTTTTSTTTTTIAGSSSTTSSTSTTTTTTTTTTIPATTTTLQVPPAGSVSVLAPTSSLEIQVVVANRGNVLAAPVTLVVSLNPRTGSGSPGSDTVRIASLAPGAQRYVNSKEMKVLKGSSYLLTVTASVPGWRTVRETVVLSVAS
jgi:hypothetical protein